MKVSVNVTLPDTLSRDEECLVAGSGDPATGLSVNYGGQIAFKRIVMSPSRPFKKVMGFRPATTLRISWDSSISREDARSDFREHLANRGVPTDLARRCEILFDNADAIDEEGTVIT
jgi:hypothetical protein